MSITVSQSQTTPPPQEARVHLGWLDSLRALAALYVVVAHTVNTVWWPPSNFHGMTLAVAAPFRYGGSAVALFIVLSGFCLMLPVTRGNGILRGGALQFFFRRTRRILPTYYAALGLSLILIHFFINHNTGRAWDDAIPVSKSDISTHILMLQDIFSHPKINPALWSVSVEWRIYFLFPLLVLLFKKVGGGRINLAMLGCAFLLLLVVQHNIFYGIAPAFFSLFTMGMLACEISFGHQEYLCKVRDNFPWLTILCPVLLINMAMQFTWRANISPIHFFAINISLGIVWATMLVGLSKPGPNRLRTCLLWKPLVFIGTFAYSIYLIHFPLVQLIWQYGVHPLNKGLLTTYVLMIFVGLPLIIGASYVFFLAFERPFLNTKKRETMAQTAQEAALSPAP